MLSTEMTETAGGRFRRLWCGDEDALLAHYRRLSPQDLRLRFLHAVSDEHLARQARRLRSHGYFVTGWFHDGVLRGVVEVGVDNREAEAGFSVERSWRNLGVGRGLMRRALRRARQAGCGRLTVMTARDNTPMIRLARGFGARISSAGGEVTGELATGRASWAEMSFELADDHIALMAAGADALWSLVDANPLRQLRGLPGDPTRRAESHDGPDRQPATPSRPDAEDSSAGPHGERPECYPLS